MKKVEEVQNLSKIDATVELIERNIAVACSQGLKETVWYSNDVFSLFRVGKEFEEAGYKVFYFEKYNKSLVDRIFNRVGKFEYAKMIISWDNNAQLRVITRI